MPADRTARYRALFETAPDGIMIVDDAGTIVDVNERMCRLLKASREQLIGKPFRDLIPPERVEDASDFSRLNTAGASTSELPLRAADGSIVELECTCRANFLPGLHLCVARDITERKRTEAELRRSHEELSDFVENATVGLHWVAADGTILWANRAELELLGYTREEYVGHHIAEFHVDPPVIEEILQRLASRQELHSYEARLRCKDGSIRYVLISSNVLWEGDRFVHTRCFTRDITDRKRAEEEVHRQRQWLHTTLSSIGDAVIATDTRGRVTFMNEVAQTLTGWTQTEAEARPLADVFSIINEQTRLPVPNPVETVLRTGRVVGLANHTLLLARDGSERAIDDSAAPIYDEAGAVIGIVLIFRDITQRRQAEAALRESEAKFHSFFLANIVPLAFWHGDGRIVDANDAYLGLTGFSREEMEAGLLRWSDLTLPGDPRLDQRAISEQEDRRGVVEPYETEYHLRDGRRIPVLIGGSFLPGFADRGVAFALDLTERRRLEEDARRLAAIVESSGDAIISKTLDGIITSWNDAAQRMYGYSPQEIIGQPLSLLTPPGVADELPIIIERLKRGERIEHYETVRRRKDGTLLQVSLSISPIRDAAGRIVGASKIARDIGAEKALREELERRVEELAEADRRKDHFLAMLAHELRNPLGAISNAVHVLQQPQGSEAVRQRAVQVLRRQVQHQARMVNELLDLSRITRGLIELHPEPLDLVRVVRDAAEDYRAALEQERIGLQVELPESPLWVMADATRLTQVVSNLLSNALKFTPSSGCVTVRAEAGADPSQVLLMVRDTGIGIEPELLPAVFDSFSQGDRTLARSRGGLGLGLAIVKGLVELHGGEVTAESAGQGEGTTVRIKLPLLQTAAEAPPKGRGPRSQERPLRVLVVEDNRDAAEMLKDLLEMNGYEVEIALTGPEGVRAARDHRPDVVLCDIGLPGMDGYEVAAALRSDPAAAPRRLVAVTGYGQDDDRRRSREAGFQYHLVKPIDPEELREVLLTLADDMGA